jgi:hypothetical protein
MVSATANVAFAMTIAAIIADRIPFILKAL